MSSSNKSTALEAQALMMTYLALAAMLATVAAAVVQPSLGASNTTTSLTLHNLCPYPVWPLVTANAGIPSMPTDADGDTFGRLDGHGNGLATLPFPSGAWSGRVVSVGGPGGAAAYSVSLVDGFNVAGGAPLWAAPWTSRPTAPRAPGPPRRVRRRPPTLFKARCPDTRTNATDVEATPQDYVAPHEIKVVFLPRA
ncbi:hypothetical protein U9M48_000356 [Paspalum notatum var. saurae]|uniref:Osmotin-like protein n=1 Tax=Paspalum notatum var. saurae TaxID=547442 RepID=A0AAQ3PGW1_PASNO